MVDRHDSAKGTAFAAIFSDGSVTRCQRKEIFRSNDINRIQFIKSTLYFTCCGYNRLLSLL